MSTSTSTIIDPALPRQRKRALAAAGVGTLVEFFDYASYSYLATTIAAVFFPQADRAAALLQAFAIFALSFAMRPIGGQFWGHYGDRLGRKKTLVFTRSAWGWRRSPSACCPGMRRSASGRLRCS